MPQPHENGFAKPAAPAPDATVSRIECHELIERLSARKAEASRYTLLAEVGRGGMGRVLRVRDEDLHRDLAMKVLRDELEPQTDPDGNGVSPRMMLSARFIEEAQVAAQLDHPGIVPVHDVGIDANGQIYFTMKLVRGRTLEKVLELSHAGLEGWSTTRVLGVLQRVCEAMSYAHDRGVLHRDLKPSNIMIGHHGEVFVMDWGLAQLIERSPRPRQGESESGALQSARHGSPGAGSSSPFVTEDGRILGTPAYMSPEQARGEREALGPASDVYSVGAILYQALTGTAPYSRPGKRLDNRAVWVALQTKTPEPVTALAPRTSAELVAICEKAMSRSIADRYRTMAELGDDLRAYLELRTVRAHRTGPVVELKKWISRNRTTAALLAAVLLLLVLGSLLLALAEQHRAREALVRLDAHHANRLRQAVAGFSALPDDDAARAEWLSDARRLVATSADRKAQLASFEADALAHGRANSTSTPADAELESRIAWIRNWVQAAQDALGKQRSIVAASGTAETTLQDARDALTILPDEISWFEAEAARLATQRPPAEKLAFQDRGQQALHDDLIGLTRDLEYLDRAGIPIVEQMGTRARELVRSTVESDDARAAWTHAAASIADRAQCPLYDGLAIRPQVGLLPLRIDPVSGLWEFWLVQSGARPIAAATGGYEMGSETAVVLVLIPGGASTAGAQAQSTDMPFHDPDANGSERIRTARLDPWFLSKYEMTQGQWLRLTDLRPSEWHAGLSPRGSRRISRSHPVEQVTWREAAEGFPRWGLRLPTEMQFERAARAGTRGRFGDGNEIAGLFGQINFGDFRFQTVTRRKEIDQTFDDGHAMHAPVGSFAPNKYGLYDVYGNVAEWCDDWYTDSCDTTPPRDGDGLVKPAFLQERVFRGGGFRSEPGGLRASSRQKMRPDRGNDDLGLRPARPLIQSTQAS